MKNVEQGRTRIAGSIL